MAGADLSLRGTLVYDDSALAPPGYEAAVARPLWPVLNVRDFGARGDDAADDTPAFRAAAAAAPASGAVIYAPAGTYRLMPQPGDPVVNAPPAVPLTRGNLVFQGEGADRTALKFRCAGDGDPLTTWRVTGENYSKISRGCLFAFDTRASKGPLRNLQLRSLALDGGAGYTGDFTVGGDPATGDGWDMSHKALLCNGDVAGVLVFCCDARDWRGEVLYCGGSLAGDFSVVNSWVHGSNASALSLSANVLCVRVTVGGPTPADYVYNGAENFATTGAQGSRFFDCLFANNSRGNALALLGVPGSKAAVMDCVFSRFGKALLASQVLHDLVFAKNTLDHCGGGCITSASVLYPKFPAGFDGWNVVGNTADASGVLLNVQGRGVDPLVVSGNVLTTAGALAAGDFGPLPPATFQFAGNTLGPGCKDYAGTWGGARGLWSGTVRPAGTGTYQQSVNDYNAASTQTVVAPVSDGVVLNDHRTPAGTTHYAVLDPATLGLYPAGYAVTFYQGPARKPWTLKADPAWNTLPADVPVPAAGVTLVFDGSKFNPK